MSTEKVKAINQTVTAQKEGYEPRDFTMKQLEAMGTDPSGQTYDGWAIVDKPETPKELTSKAKVIKTATKPKDSDATTGETNGSGESGDSGSDDSATKDSIHSGQGDSGTN